MENDEKSIISFYGDHKTFGSVMYTLVSRVQMTFYTQTKGYRVPGNQGTHDKLNQIQNVYK